MTGEIITVGDQHLGRTRQAPDRSRRAKAEELVDWSCVPDPWDIATNKTSEVRININVQALRVEYKSGLFDFFRSPGSRPVVVDHFSMEIRASARDAFPALIEGITSLSNVTPPCHIGEIEDAADAGHRFPSSYADVGDDAPSLESRRPASHTLDIWV